MDVVELPAEFGQAGDRAWSDGPLVLGVPWEFDERLVRAAQGWHQSWGRT